MGKATGFLEFERCEDGWIPAKTRIRDFNEFHVHLNEEARKCQTNKCMPKDS